MKQTYPTKYIIEYTHRRTWEQLHRVPGEPADPLDYRRYMDVRTLRLARKEVKYLLQEWEFAQPVISRRCSIMPVQWDWSTTKISDKDDEDVS